MTHAINRPSRDDIVTEARSWIDTPFHHQGRIKGVGVDCAGVAVGVAKAFGFACADVVGYARVPSDGQFEETVESVLVRIEREDVLPGDLMTFRFIDDPQHIAVVSAIDPVMLVHAWSDAGKCVENRLDEKWQRRLHRCYRFRVID